MLRVREVAARVPPRDGKGLSAEGVDGVSPRGAGPARLIALAALGIALGSGSMVLTASLVAADDDAGIRAFYVEEAARKAAQLRAQHAAYMPPRASAYAPAAQGWRLPLLQTRPDGRIAHPPVALNPFRQVARKETASRSRKHQNGAVALAPAPAHGVAARGQTFCVRLCDGFHAPIGQLRAAGDMKAHEALCKAMNPGVPVKVFRAAMGSSGINDAVAADGQRYTALPMAYSHEKAADPACRPAIVQAGERRISLLRDITLRPGDSVVLDGKVSTFAGSSTWPYSRHDFRDFRTASELSKGQRRQIDEQVGVSRMEAEAGSVRRQMRVREARLLDDAVGSDALLRGSLDPVSHGPVRQIPLPTRNP